VHGRRRWDGDARLDLATPRPRRPRHRDRHRAGRGHRATATARAPRPTRCPRGRRIPREWVMNDTTNENQTLLPNWTSSGRHGDMPDADPFLSDDFVGVVPLGFALPKEAWIGRHRGGDLVYDAFDLDEIDTHPHGDATIVVARHDARGAYQGHPLPEALRAT